MHLRGGKKKKRTKKKSSSWPVFITEVMPCPTAPYLHAFTGSHILRAGAAVRWCDGGLGGTCCVQHGKFMPWWEMGAHGAAASCFPPSTHISVHLVKQGFVQCFLYVKKQLWKNVAPLSPAEGALWGPGRSQLYPCSADLSAGLSIFSPWLWHPLLVSLCGVWPVSTAWVKTSSEQTFGFHAAPLFPPHPSALEDFSPLIVSLWPPQCWGADGANHTPGACLSVIF